MTMFANLDILSLFWIATSVCVVLTHLLLSVESIDLLPGINSVVTLIKSLFLFGKLKRTDKAMETSKCEDTPFSSVPKSWFSHFYIVGTVVHTAVLACFFYQLLEHSLPHALEELILRINRGSVDGNYQNLEINALPVLIVFILEFLQITRRMFECLLISTFSSGTMSFVHYFYGLFLYTSFGIGLLSSVKGQASSLSMPRDTTDFIWYAVGISMFLWGNYYQHKCMVTFADLRQEQKEKKAMDHYIPRGHLFELLSTPHYFCEIIIYAAFCIIFQFKNYYLLSIALFVWTNQIVSGLAVHKWYQKRFQSYPANRKAVIPYIL